VPEGGGFELARQGERVEGLAQGIDRQHLLRLRRGEWRVERRVDLHGLTAPEARRELASELGDAVAAGERCVLVIHGRGLHSESGPVLQGGVLTWLTTPPLAARVMAFASALPRDGGPGASYVLLRRTRPG
jgi:DNA-nicking Smr family endonuclease